MSESAEAVAADVSSRRSVTVEITNVTNNYCLINPKYVHTGISGLVQNEIYHIDPKKTSCVCLFCWFKGVS